MLELTKWIVNQISLQENEIAKSEVFSVRGAQPNTVTTRTAVGDNYNNVFALYVFLYYFCIISFFLLFVTTAACLCVVTVGFTFYSLAGCNKQRRKF